jgi:hypothetical protein
MRSVVRDYPNITWANAERIRDLMNAHVHECLVTGYEDLIPDLFLPDPNDRHVLAAAIRAGAEVIVTANLADFPDEALAPFGIEARHPDDFIRHLFDLDPGSVCLAAKRQRESLKKPAKTVDEYLKILLRQGLPQTVAAFQQFVELI